MKDYICNRCNKEFKYKQNYKRHINKKNPCKIEEYYKCDTCNKEFDRKYNYERHMKDVCMKDILYCQYCNKKYKNKFTKNRHEKYTCKLKPIDDAKIINNTINNINNNIHNNQTYKNINDNRIININLYGFTKEDFSKLPQGFIETLLNKGVNSIHNLVKYTNCNSNTPQFHNLLITNKKENYIHVFNGDTWELANKKETINKLIDHRFDYLMDRYYELKEKNLTTPKIDRKIKLFENAFYNEDKELIKKIKNELEFLLYNSKNIIKNTRKDNITL
jgi:hypothetical protein